MPTLSERILALVSTTPGLTDREITDRLLGPGVHQVRVNQAARVLVGRGQLNRHLRSDGKIGNYPGYVPQTASGPDEASDEPASDPLSEDDLKRKLVSWLRAGGWTVTVVWGKSPGIDLDAIRDDARWIIEVKGRGSLNAMRVNYFLMVLGETLRRMDDPQARYSIALPDLAQYRGLWTRLPRLAKSRTQTSALFVSDSGEVEEVY